MHAPAELEGQAEVLEAQAIELETQGRPVAAQAKLQQAKSRRDHATTLRQQSGEPQTCTSEVGTVAAFRPVVLQQQQGSDCPVT